MAPWWRQVVGADGGTPRARAQRSATAATTPSCTSPGTTRWRTPPGRARLPTEAEWEYAARGGLEGARFAWGDELTPRGTLAVQHLPGHVPHREHRRGRLAHDGAGDVVRPNGYGLHGIAGNVWEWCADWFAADAYAHAAERTTRAGPATASSG